MPDFSFWTATPTDELCGLAKAYIEEIHLNLASHIILIIDLFLDMLPDDGAHNLAAHILYFDPGRIVNLATGLQFLIDGGEISSGGPGLYAN